MASSISYPMKLYVNTFSAARGDGVVGYADSTGIVTKIVMVGWRDSNGFGRFGMLRSIAPSPSAMKRVLRYAVCTLMCTPVYPLNQQRLCISNSSLPHSKTHDEIQTVKQQHDQLVNTCFHSDLYRKL